MNIYQLCLYCQNPVRLLMQGQEDVVYCDTCQTILENEDEIIQEDDGNYLPMDPDEYYD